MAILLVHVSVFELFILNFSVVYSLLMLSLYVGICGRSLICCVELGVFTSLTISLLRERESQLLYFNCDVAV